MTQYTPMMTHYLEIKDKNPDTLVFYRLGDFYEMFFDDAKTASRELDLLLTGRNAGVSEKVPMCGVPFRAVSGYVQRLINKGYKVAIVEQLEDPSEAIGLVKRDVVKIITPGTIMDELVDEKTSVYLASIVDYSYGYAVAIVESTTGQTKLKNIKHDINDLAQLLTSNEVNEVVVDEDFSQAEIKEIKSASAITISYCQENCIGKEYEYLAENISNIYLLKAIGKIINYLIITQKKEVKHLRPFLLTSDDEYLLMDYSTINNMDLIKPTRTNIKEITLYSFLDKTRSSLGSRKLRSWISQPLRKVEKINQRLDMIAYLLTNFMLKEQLKEYLDEVYDIERIITKISYGSCTPKDCAQLRSSLGVVPAILSLIKESKIYPEFNNLDDNQDIHQLLVDSLVENPPLLVSDGGVFVEGYNQQLDEYRNVSRGGQSWIAELEQKEKERTQIKTLKIGYNRVFGYYIEISKGALSQVDPAWGYTRKQTLSTGERYITEELKQQEDIILHSQERALKLESQLFTQLVNKLKEKLASLQIMADALAVIDSNYALSVISSNHDYVRPTFNDKGVLNIVKGKHPILNDLKDVNYVANDIYMDNNISTFIITGPNMGGKSTYLRQCLLLVILAQIGCYVPAKKADFPIFDKIFTRLGSSDDILAGQSTFMVEMSEANNALQNATKDSLIVFDELGRGTSTYDGMALAQAMIEYIDSSIQAKTLFSTHYHELTTLADCMDKVVNKQVAVKEENEKISFLYQLIDGKANRSYGIHVASLAKLPKVVIERSKVLLKDFESTRIDNVDRSKIVVMEKENPQVELVKDMLNAVDPNRMTPIEALQLVADLKEKIKDE